MSPQATSTSRDSYSENALERLRLSRVLSEPLMLSFQAFHQMLEDLSASSCGDSPGVPVSSLPESDSQAA